MNRPTDTEALSALQTLRRWLAPELAPVADEWISLRPRAEIPGFSIKGRCVIDAARRGELELSRLGGKPSVRRSELQRWAESRRKAPKERAERSDDAADDYERLVAEGGR